MISALSTTAQTNYPPNHIIEEFATDVLNVKLGNSYNRNSVEVGATGAAFGRNNHNVRCRFKYSGSSRLSENTGYVELEIITTDDTFGDYKYFVVKFFKIYGCELVNSSQEYISLLNLDYPDKRPNILYDKKLDKVSGSIAPRLIVMFK